MLSDDDMIACMEAALQTAKDERVKKAEQKPAEARRVAEENAVEEHRVVEEC